MQGRRSPRSLGYIYLPFLLQRPVGAAIKKCFLWCPYRAQGERRGFGNLWLRGLRRPCHRLLYHAPTGLLAATPLLYHSIFMMSLKSLVLCFFSCGVFLHAAYSRTLCIASGPIPHGKIFIGGPLSVSCSTLIIPFMTCQNIISLFFHYKSIWSEPKH
jgi:hypothetical protein